MRKIQPSTSSYRESIKTLEADIQHANTLAAALPTDSNGECLQMKLSYSPFAPFVLFLVEWMDYSCTDNLPSYLGLLHILIYKIYVNGVTCISSKERRATLREFYAVIYPSLRQLEGELIKAEDNNQNVDMSSKNRMAEGTEHCDEDPAREDECGICLEACTKMVLPKCGHAMCMNCFQDWTMRSKTCPFCRGSLKRVNSSDLWVLTSTSDIVDSETLSQENVRHFYLYIDNLPLAMPENIFFTYNYML